MPTDTNHTVQAPRLSIVAILAGCALFIALLLVMRNGQAPVQIDLKKVAETDRWKYSPEGRSSKLSEIRAKEQLLATTYGWVDQKAGIVRLPIDRSLELTLQEINANRIQ